MDKDGQILNFSCNLADFLLKLVSGNDDESLVIEKDSLVFSMNGRLLKTAFDDIYVDESNEYDDADAYINDFFEHGLTYHEF